MAFSDAALSAPVLHAAVLFFADFADLPLRGAMAPCPIHVPTGLASSDADCAGITFPVADSRVLEIGPVSQGEGGSDALGFTLLADPTDTALMSAIENPALYMGRRVRLWLALWDPAAAPVAGGAQVSQLRPLYRGYMTQPAQAADADRYVITMAAENYRWLLSGPQSRSYSQTTLIDPADQAGAVMRGQRGSVPWVPGGGGGGGDFNLREFEQER